MTFEGISKTIYGMKKMVRAVLNWLPVRFRSVTKWKLFALAIFTRSKKASR